MNEEEIQHEIKKYATKIIDLIYISAMGDGWHIYLCARAIKIVNELKDRKATPPIDCEDFWDRVINYLEIISKN